MVISKIPLLKVFETIKKANTGYLLVSIICFIASQWVSAERLAIVFKSAAFTISRKLNYILYLLGMFYNFFIPGGVGGDAYKVYYLNKKHKWSVKKLSAAVIYDRFTGLVAICFLLLVFALFIPFFQKKTYIFLIILCFILGVISSILITKKFFKCFYNSYFTSLALSFGVQLLQCLSIFFILKSLYISKYHIEYILVFLTSSVLSVVSFAGIGVREAVFYQASEVLSFNSTTAVTIGMLFSIFTTLISVFGILFHFRKNK